MTVESFDPVQQAVSVTPTAVEHFKRQLVGHKEARAVRLSVKQSGCTGFMYVVDLVPEGQADDLHYALAEGVELLVDVLNRTVADMHGSGQRIALTIDADAIREVA